MRYMVQHDALDGWRRATILTDDELSGLDVGRLVAVGALVPLHEQPTRPDAPVTDPLPDAPPAPDLSRLTFRALQRLAEERGIKHLGLTKAKLLAALSAG